jgi:hypothetical protein
MSAATMKMMVYEKMFHDYIHVRIWPTRLTPERAMVFYVFVPCIIGSRSSSLSFGHTCELRWLFAQSTNFNQFSVNPYRYQKVTHPLLRFKFVAITLI